MAIYLVTGVAGFIGSRVAELLLAEGHTVVGVDNLNDYYDVRLKDYRLGRLLGEERWRANADPRRSVYAEGGRRQGAGGRFVFEAADIENQTALEPLFAEFGFSAVFNLGARAGMRQSMADPQLYLRTNTLGTINLLECQRKFGVTKQVLASTSSLYAGCPLPFTEDQPVNTPLSPYAASKKAAEMMAYSYHKLYGLDFSVLRFFTVFGPAGRPDMSIFRFIQWIEAGKPIRLFGDGTQSRDFTYVDDIARGVLLAARPLGYEVVNLGGGREPVTLQALIALLEKSLGKRAHIEGAPFQSGDIRETAADVSKAGRLLGWRPQVGLAEGLGRAVEWHQANRDWLASVQL
jgi:nucleoside-diphosphate-sugar epimerase